MANIVIERDRATGEASAYLDGVLLASAPDETTLRRLLYRRGGLLDWCESLWNIACDAAINRWG